MVAGILHHIRWLAEFLGSIAPIDEQRSALAAVIDATDGWKEQ
jgi:hypothetical protein